MEDRLNKRQRPKLDMNILKRLISYISKNYKKRFILVFICVILTSISMVAGSLYLQVLIDDYITPLIGVNNPNFGPFIGAIGVMIVIYSIGTLSGFIQSRVMVDITQGTLKLIRDEMFVKMQRLPIKYFDTHTHGDIMSRYTNDTDTLSQMISQSIPQLISSAITIVAVFVAMIVTNRYLTAVVIVSLAIMLSITKNIASASGLSYVEKLTNGTKNFTIVSSNKVESSMAESIKKNAKKVVFFVLLMIFVYKRVGT